jgi:hypothetical protein
MKLVRSDSTEVARSIASSRALACWGWSALTLACIASVLSLLIVLAISFIFSMRAADWVAVPVFLALNAFLFWRGRSPRLNWVVAGCAGRVYVRLFVGRGPGYHDTKEPNAILLAPEVASMSSRTVEVFLYGLKPRIVESLVIEPTQMAADVSFNGTRSLLCGTHDSVKQTFLETENGRFIMNWKWCRPDLRTFLGRVARECPTVAVSLQDHCELDLNGIWNGLREKPNGQQRRMLVQAKRLGFGSKCAELLSLHRCMTHQEAAAYLAEIEQEEAETGPAAVRDEFLWDWRARS